MVSLSSDPETARRQKDAFRATFMRLDPWLNAAQLRFGYGITLHRAQGSRFPTVFLNFETGQGQENGAYFRWVYTGFTIASRQLVMINVPKITLVSKAQWSVPANPSGEVMPKNSIAYNPNLNRVADPAFPNLALQNLFSYIVSSIKDNGIDVKLLGRHNYQEIYQFSKEPGHNCTVRMYYNSKYEVTRIDSLDSTPPEFFEQITDLLVAPRAPQEGFSAELYEYLAPVFQDSGLKIIGLEHHPFQDVYYIAKGRQRAAIQIFYDSDGFVTRVSPAAYTDAKIIPTIRTAMGV